MREPVTAILSKVLHTFPPTVGLFRVFQCNKLYFETLQYRATGCVVMLVLEVPVVAKARLGELLPRVYVQRGRVVCQCTAQFARVGQACGCNVSCAHGSNKAFEI